MLVICIQSWGTKYAHVSVEGDLKGYVRMALIYPLCRSRRTRKLPGPTAPKAVVRKAPSGDRPSGRNKSSPEEVSPHPRAHAHLTRTQHTQYTAGAVLAAATAERLAAAVLAVGQMLRRRTCPFAGECGDDLR
jgi:hypothetical protein